MKDLKKDFKWYTFILLWGLGVGFIFGLGEKVSAIEIKKAEKICENKGGLHESHFLFGYAMECTCNNGEVIKID